MRCGIIFTVLACLVSSPVLAKGHHHYRQQITHQHYDGGICSRRLDDGQTIHVSCTNASRFVGFLNALYHREGRLAEVVCQAWGHMPGSLHHTGNACDVGQSARNIAWKAMYHISDLAREYGLTDGCWWRNPDCGHVDMSGYGGGEGRHYAKTTRRTHYARRAHIRHATAQNE